MPDALRPEMPLWCAPRVPVAQARSLNQPQVRLLIHLQLTHDCQVPARSWLTELPAFPRPGAAFFTLGRREGSPRASGEDAQLHQT